MIESTILLLQVWRQILLWWFREGCWCVELDALILFQTVLSNLTLCNFSVNFYLYCLSGTRFRKEFWSFLGCCGRTRPSHTQSYVSSDVTRGTATTVFVTSATMSGND